MQPVTINPEPTEVDAAIAWHDGDARAAVATLLDDVRHLRLQLALAEGVMSRGMVRGWRPAYGPCESGDA
ncbi:hypothetical protein DEM27_22200 [Metarhizobium album]|uniref:Uncharacterized protein n=1 Tax=Metarhizobium album TaxID=2182425 RepID=A0A2U2DLH1_9HYPH|nr:hypothetical protein [Rhizobium album]PWE54153.1 hypothetical protein DEM27_22200 [Rhizobium album]